MAIATDSSLWTTEPVFGVAGGPDKVVLTTEGRARAFCVGAQVKSGAAAEALEALGSKGEALLSVRGEGARMELTALGHRFDQVAWGYLRARGLVESFQEGDEDGVRLTDAGKRAVLRGIEEREYLLERCRACYLELCEMAKHEPCSRFPSKPA